jgi:transcriptional regulator with XRE-family HTH domain
VPPTPDLRALGIAIRVYRAQVQVSQEELAYRAGMHRTYLSGIERGERNPSFQSIVAIANALGIQPSALIARAEQLEREPTTG